MKKTLIVIGILSLTLTLSFSQDQKVETDSIYGFLDVDVPAIFPGCENYEGIQKKICSKEALDSYIDNVMEYPTSAKRLRVEGKCIIEYTVLSDGSMTDIDLVKDIGEGCGEESLRIFHQLQASGDIWQPAEKDKQKVSIRMKAVIKFYLSIQGVFIPVESKKEEKSKEVYLGGGNF